MRKHSLLYLVRDSLKVFLVGNIVLIVFGLVYSIITPFPEAYQDTIIVDCVKNNGDIPCSTETLFGIFFNNHIKAREIIVIAHGGEGYLATSTPYYTINGLLDIVKYYPYFILGVVARFNAQGNKYVGVNVEVLISLSRMLGLWDNSREIHVVTCDKDIQELLEEP